MKTEKTYLDILKEVEEMVKEEEIPFYKNRVPYRQQQELLLSLRGYCESKCSANYYKGLEKTKPMYKKERMQSEYLEILTSTRVRLKLQASDNLVLQNYVISLREKLERALIEPNANKRFKLYDFICAGCSLCQVQNQEIVEQITKIKEEATQIIQDIPIM